MYLAGHASVTLDATGSGFQLNQTGNAQQYLMNGPSGEQCGYIYDNPVTPVDTTSEGASSKTQLTSVIQSINEIMFTLATDVYWSESVPPYSEYNGSMIKTNVLHYQTNFPYMWGAFASMMACFLLVLPSYWGFWQLGRKVCVPPNATKGCQRTNTSPCAGVSRTVRDRARLPLAYDSHR